MMVKLSKHKSNLNVLTRGDLRTFLTLLWHWWHRQCIPSNWHKEAWSYGHVVLGFCRCHSPIMMMLILRCKIVSLWFRSILVTHFIPTILQPPQAVQYSKLKPNSSCVTTFWHYQLFFPISCWSIHFCMDTYSQSTLGWLGFADWWFITQNSIKLKVSVIY